MNKVSGTDIKGRLAEIQELARNGEPTAILHFGKTGSMLMPPEWEEWYSEEMQALITSAKAKFGVMGDIELIKCLLTREPALIVELKKALGLQ